MGDHPRRSHHAFDGGRRTPADLQRLDADGNLGDGRSRRQLPADPVATGEAHVGGTVDDELRREGFAHLEAALVRHLTLGKVLRGKGIGPALAIPVIDMLAEYDEMRARDGLGGVELCEEVIRGRAGGTAFGGEQFDEHRHSGCFRARSGREHCESGGEREARAAESANQALVHARRVAALGGPDQERRGKTVTA
jgi:hypothetical protein